MCTYFLVCNGPLLLLLLLSNNDVRVGKGQRFPGGTTGIIGAGFKTGDFVIERLWGLS